MLIRAFGAIDVEVPGSERRPVAGRRPRRLLALLVSRAGQLVGDDVIAEAVWGDRPPASARTAVQTYMSALRDELEPGRPRHSAGNFIVNEPGGYRLVASTDDVDVLRFDALIDEAAELHRSDPTAATQLLDEVLELWSVPPFAEFADEPLALPAVARLRERHATAIEARVGLALDTELGDDVFDLLNNAVALYPYRERLAGQLMLLNYRRGEQQRALEVFGATRRRLVDDLGLEPGRELQLLQRAILEQDPSLLRRNRDATSVPTTTRAPTYDDGLPPSKRLIGRDRDVTAVAEHLTSGRTVTITGPGGAGKSALAVTVARDLQRRFGLRVQYVDLARHQARSVWRALASELQVVEHPLAPLDATIADVLAETPTLLVVETCEVAPDEVADLATRLRDVDGLRVLMTSQVPVGAASEQLHRLSGVDEEAAVDLLTRSLPLGDDAPDRPVVVEIVRRLGCLPLGLELAAARLPSLGAVELLRQLDRDPDVLAAGEGRPDRQRSVRAAADWSIGLLDKSTREVLATLAAFSSPFTLSLAEALVDDGPLSSTVVDLVERSLLERRGGDTGTPTFRIPDDVAESVRFAAPDVFEAGRRALAELVCEVAQRRFAGRRVTSDDGGTGPSIDDLSAEVMPTLAFLDEQSDVRCLLVAGLLGTFFQAKGLVSEGREQLVRAIDRYGQAPAIIVVAAAAQAGFLAWYQGDGKECERLLEAIVERVDEVPLPGFADTVLGCRAFSVGDYDGAAARLETASQALHGVSTQRMLMENLAGNAAWYAGRLDRAEEHYRCQRDVAEQVGDEFNDAQARRFEAMLLAYRARRDGEADGATGERLERAWRLAERSRVMSMRLADPMSGSQSAAALAVLQATVGELDEAARDATHAVELSRRQFDVFALRTSLPVLALRSLDAGDVVAGAETLGWYLDLLDRTGQGHSMAAGDLAEQAIERARGELGATGFARSAATGAARTIGELADVVRRTA